MAARKSRWSDVWWLNGAVGLSLLGCSDNALPGTLLGTYRIEATLQAATCGSGLGAPNPWTFDVQLSEQDSTLYWSRLDGSPALYNTVDAQRSATMTSTQTENVDGTVDGGLGPCTMVRNDIVQLTLASSNPPNAFQGTIGYTFAAESGSDCTDQLSATGGIYDTLPCSLSYSIVGARQ